MESRPIDLPAAPTRRLLSRVLRLPAVAFLLSACASPAPHVVDRAPDARQIEAPRSVSYALERAAISSELGRLAPALDDHYRREHVFTSNLGDIDFSPKDGVSIRLAAAASRWSAEAFHTRLGPDEKCVMWNGAADPDRLRTRLLPGFNVPRRFVQCTWDPGNTRQRYELRLTVEASATQSARDAMRADLRRLVRFQQEISADSGIVTGEPMAAGFAFSIGVSASIRLYGDSDWSAVATHDDVEPLYRCAVWDGDYRDAGSNLLPGGRDVPTPRTVRCTW